MHEKWIMTNGTAGGQKITEFLILTAYKLAQDPRIFLKKLSTNIIQGFKLTFPGTCD